MLHSKFISIYNTPLQFGLPLTIIDTQGQIDIFPVASYI